MLFAGSGCLRGMMGLLLYWPVPLRIDVARKTENCKLHERGKVKDGGFACIAASRVSEAQERLRKWSPLSFVICDRSETNVRKKSDSTRKCRKIRNILLTLTGKQSIL